MRKRWQSLLLAVLVLVSLLGIVPVTARAESAMTSSDALIGLLKTMEGFTERPMWDYGQWTVGYGTQCPNELVAEYQANGISIEAAEQLLRTHLNNFEAKINAFIDTHQLTLQQHQFDALVCFTFNCGGSWLQETDGFFNRAVRSGDVSNAFLYGICLWSSASGDYILMKRRMCEANIYINGVYEWTQDGTVYPDNFRWVFLDANGGAVRYQICGFDAANPAPVNAVFTQIPTGVDPAGNPYEYTLDGWYTQEGTKVENLDTNVVKDQVLQARWLDRDGNVVEFPKGTEIEPLSVTVTANGVNIRSGPATYYPKVETGLTGDVLTVTRVYETSSYTWGLTEKGWIALRYTTYETAREKNGWVQVDGRLCFYENGIRVTNAWVRDSVGWCYLDASGYLLTNGWAKDSRGWCCVGPDGHQITGKGWARVGDKWAYLNDQGYCVTNAWVRDSLGWVYLGETGEMLTNARVKDSRGWCCVGADGYQIVVPGWVLMADGWSYVGGNGYCVTKAWVRDSVGWCYLDANGKMVTNAWVRDSVGLCYVGSDGYCVTDEWVLDDKGWCYLDREGRKVTNRWILDSVGWCYVDKSGYCITNAWMRDSVGWCYLDGSGRMVYDTWVQDSQSLCRIDENGYWTGERK